MDSNLPSASDLSLCTSILRRLKPSDLQLDELKELSEVGAALFKSRVCKEQFGSADVVDFLKKKHSTEKRIAELQRLEETLAHRHEARKDTAHTAGMNIARKTALAQIKKECMLSLGDEEEVVNLRAVTDSPDIANVDSVISTITNGKRNAAEHVSVHAEDLPPRDDFYAHCNICRADYTEDHHFYHQLCPECAKLNWEKRGQSADLSGFVCVVTGGRVRIGYQTVLKLLRAGAFVLTTTRYPADAALRYSKEDDFEEWRERLEVCGPLELCDMRLVERFCDQLAQRFKRIHILVNNAAQTLTRREGWALRMGDLEQKSAAGLSPAARDLLRSPVQLMLTSGSKGGYGTEAAFTGDSDAVPEACSALVPAAPRAEEEVMWIEAAELQDFPAGQLDDSRQPLDLSTANSWSRRLREISSMELLQTLAANAASPFIMCSRLANQLAPSSDEEPYGHIINVSALEGKFSVKRKSNGHPHTNMAKAALNMLTHTSASDLFQIRVLMNCVDTGWVSDMAPGGVGVVAATHASFVGPPLDEVDGAARVLDPVFMHLNDPTWLIRGRFFKNYFVAGW
eukprot:TRINITY_DN63550_c0_g1_i1.p1 TRINITY_DN63550_c0_g1~~TRINITY_DN63550_c0_g1_i1.p1  ORF type:complete len:570 (-),score=128.78 TRINITY_DN63550_c0_g1_i1:31-1740(-)